MSSNSLSWKDQAQQCTREMHRVRRCLQGAVVTCHWTTLRIATIHRQRPLGLPKDGWNVPHIISYKQKSKTSRWRNDRWLNSSPVMAVCAVRSWSNGGSGVPVLILGLLVSGVSWSLRFSGVGFTSRWTWHNRNRLLTNVSSYFIHKCPRTPCVLTVFHFWDDVR